MKDDFLARKEAIIETSDDLRQTIEKLEAELKAILDRTDVFEAQLYAQISDLIIEEQELTLVYKQMQRDKKEKRRAQKLKGKKAKGSDLLRSNTIEPSIEVAKPLDTAEVADIKKTRKRLYREAMQVVHPDKFSINDSSADLATELTAKLVEIFHSGDLEKLQLFHGHIMSGLAFKGGPLGNVNSTNFAKTASYYKNEIARLMGDIALAKKVHTYIVLTTYSNPMSFVVELKEYYMDRIGKLMKRTRKVRK